MDDNEEQTEPESKVRPQVAEAEAERAGKHAALNIGVSAGQAMLGVVGGAAGVVGAVGGTAARMVGNNIINDESEFSREEMRQARKERRAHRREGR